MEKIKEEWFDYVVNKDSFESADIGFNAERICNWWLSHLQSQKEEMVRKIEEELELSCVDDRLLGKTDEYLVGYNTSTERWRAKRDNCLDIIRDNK